MRSPSAPSPRAGRGWLQLLAVLATLAFAAGAAAWLVISGGSSSDYWPWLAGG